MTKKTICSITPCALESDSRTLKIAASFAREGHRSIVIVGQPSKTSFDHLGIEVLFEERKDFSPKTKWDSFLYKRYQKYYCVSKNKYIRDFSHSKLHNMCYKAYYDFSDLPKADIYYFHGFSYAGLLQKLPKKAIVAYDAHDYYADCGLAFNEFEKKWVAPYYLSLEKALIKKSKVFVTVNDPIATLYKDTFKKDSLIVRNAHDDRLDDHSIISLREHFSLTQKDFLICHLGNAKPATASEEIINAITHLSPHIYLCFVGKGYKEMDKPCIHTIDAVSPQHIVPFIKTSDLGIISYLGVNYNYTHILPNRFFQYLAAGIPILFSSELKEISKLNETYHFGIPIDMRNPDIIKKTILDLIQQPEKLVRLKANCKKAQRDLCWENEEKKLFQALGLT